MDPEAKLQMLRIEVDQRIERQVRKRKHDKRMAFRLRMASVVFAGMVTILLGIEVTSDLSPWLKNIALVLGASITVVSAFDAFYDYRSLWIRRTVNLARLSGLSRDIEFYSAGTEPGEYDMDQIIKFKNRLDRIQRDDLREWLKLRSESGIRSEDAQLRDIVSQSDS